MLRVNVIALLVLVACLATVNALPTTPTICRTHILPRQDGGSGDENTPVPTDDPAAASNNGTSGDAPSPATNGTNSDSPSSDQNGTSEIAPGLQPLIPDAVNRTLWAVLSSNPSFSIFTRLIQTHDLNLVNELNSQPAAGMSLESTNNYTVFAPVDAAFKSLSDNAIFPLFLNPLSSMLATPVLQYHIHNGSDVQAGLVPSNGSALSESTLSPLGNVALRYADKRPDVWQWGMGKGDSQQNGGGNSQNDNSTMSNDNSTMKSDNSTTEDNQPQNNTQSQNLYVNAAQIIYPDVKALNGFIQVVDSLITPIITGDLPKASGNGGNDNPDMNNGTSNNTGNVVNNNPGMNNGTTSNGTVIVEGNNPDTNNGSSDANNTAPTDGGNSTVVIVNGS